MKKKTKAWKTIDKEFREAFEFELNRRYPSIDRETSLRRRGFRESIIFSAPVSDEATYVAGFNAGLTFMDFYFDRRREEIDRALEQEFGWVNENALPLFQHTTV